MKREAKNSIFNLGGDLELALKMEVARAIEQGSIVKSFNKVPIFDFKEYCVITYIATKFAVLRVKSEAKQVQDKRLIIIKKNGETVKDWAKSDITDEYATFVVAQNQAEASYFDTALDTVFKELGITQI